MKTKWFRLAPFWYLYWLMIIYELSHFDIQLHEIRVYDRCIGLLTTCRLEEQVMYSFEVLNPKLNKNRLILSFIPRVNLLFIIQVWAYTWSNPFRNQSNYFSWMVYLYHTFVQNVYSQCYNHLCLVISQSAKSISKLCNVI